MTDFILPLQFTVHEVHDYMFEHFGVTPFHQYCSVTGRPYGEITIHELETTIRFLDNDDLESFCDDLFVRMIAGMRPSLNWSRVEPITIEFARHNDKAGLLSYLVHRVNESKPSADMTFAEMMDRNQKRIKTYRKIATLVEQVDTFELVQLLLQADSFGNLHRFTAPIYQGKVPVLAKLFDESTLDAAHYPALVEQTRKWVESILVILEKESRVAMSDVRAAATYGNRLTTMAYSRSWMEKPVSALTPEARKRKESKADGTWAKRTKRAIAAAKKQEEIDSLFASVEAAMKPSKPRESVAAQIAKVKPQARRFTAGMFGKKVEA